MTRFAINGVVCLSWSFDLSTTRSCSWEQTVHGDGAEVEDLYHYRFWSQVVRWMAHQRHISGNEGIA